MRKKRFFQSSFAQQLTDYIELRSALGFAKSTYQERAFSFDRFCVDNYPDEALLTEKLVNAWILYGDPSMNVVSSRCSFIKLFGEYLKNTGHTAYVFPEEFFPKLVQNHMPYLFSEEELKSFFHEVDAYEDSLEPFVPIILSVYFRLAYTCGLRPSETRSILRDNVSLASGEILIKNSKNRKDRYVVVSDAMAELLTSYCAIRDIFYKNNPYLFPKGSDDCYGSAWYQRYYKLFFAKIHPAVPEEDLPPVRVYDLRHMFASTVIHKWMAEEAVLTNKLPFLQVYMGHKTLSETSYYVHLIPERLLAGKGIEWDHMNAMIPEVFYEES